MNYQEWLTGFASEDEKQPIWMGAKWRKKAVPERGELPVAGAVDPNAPMAKKKDLTEESPPPDEVS